MIARYALVMCLIATVSAGAASAQDRSQQIASADRKDTIVVGRTTEDPKKHFPRLEAMANYLAARLSDHRIKWGDVEIATNNKNMIRKLKMGSIDLLSETPLSALLLEEEAGMEFLLREWKGGAPSYYSLFVKPVGSTVTSLADLKGRKIAFEDPGSTSAFLIPAAALRTAGMELVELGSFRDNAPSDKVGYFFAIGEINILALVIKGFADAGAFSNNDWNDLLRSPEGFKAKLEILDQTPLFLRSTVIVRKDLDPTLKRKIAEILIAMADDAEGKKVMKKYNKATKYDPFEGQAARDLTEARRVFETVRDLVNP